MTHLTLRLPRHIARLPGRYPAGWWLLPAVIGGAVGWVALIAFAMRTME